MNSLKKPRSKRLSSRILRALKSYAFRFRLVAVVALIAFWSSIAFLGYFYSANANKENTYRNLNIELSRLVTLKNNEGLGALITDLNIEEYSFSLYTYYTFLRDVNGKKIAGNLAYWPDNFDETEQIAPFELNLPSLLLSDTPMREMIGRAHVFKDGSELLIANSTEVFVVYRNLLSGLGYTALMVIVPPIVLISLIMALAFQNQFDSFNRSIRRIMAGDLSERIPVGPGTVESREMAENLNTMLDRISLLMDDVRRVSDNIAHDLNTPLSRLRNEINTLLQQSTPEMQPKVEKILVECNHILETFRSLLSVAKIESGGVAIDKTLVDLSTVLNDVFELYEPLAQDKELQLRGHLQKGCEAYCDRNLVFQVVANIVDNAIKYSYAGSQISIGVRHGIVRGDTESLAASDLEYLVNEREDDKIIDIETDNYLSVLISDEGIGLPTESHNKIFQRFYREEKSRSIKPGSGLGLSMVMAVMRIHRGAIYIKNNNPGTCFILVFPRSEIKRS